MYPAQAAPQVQEGAHFSPIQAPHAVRTHAHVRQPCQRTGISWDDALKIGEPIETSHRGKAISDTRRHGTGSNEMLDVALDINPAHIEGRQVLTGTPAEPHIKAAPVAAQSPTSVRQQVRAGQPSYLGGGGHRLPQSAAAWPAAGIATPRSSGAQFLTFGNSVGLA